jgi:hypothetical protein
LSTLALSGYPFGAMTQGQGGWPALPCMTFTVTPVLPDLPGASPNIV